MTDKALSPLSEDGEVQLPQVYGPRRPPQSKDENDLDMAYFRRNLFQTLKMPSSILDSAEQELRKAYERFLASKNR